MTGTNLVNYTANQVSNPELTPSTTFSPTLNATDDHTLAATGQLMSTPNNQIGLQTPVANPTSIVTPTITAAKGTATQVDSAPIAAQVNPTAATYQAKTISDQTPQATAEQGTVNQNSLVQEQLKKLYTESQPGMIPEWARGAVIQANEQMASRGMGNSTIGIAATAAAIQASALPIAAQDASTYFQMDLKNLDNRQQTSLANLQVRQQSLLSDQAVTNAANQFNASSQSQTQQFVATLMSSIQQQNADRLTAMSQFNTGQENQVASANATNSINTQEFTATQKAAADQFNAQMSYARDQFNAQAAFAVEQSNVTWRRSLNTANTAAINAANQINTQNRFNMSQTAQNNLWQQWRDEAAWSFQASESAKNRQYNIVMAANGRPTNTSFNSAQAVGSFVSALLF